MTNYNERLDEILYAHNDAIKSLHHKIRYQDCKLTPDELLGMEEAVSAEAKQAITSLIKELVAEARMDELNDVPFEADSPAEEHYKLRIAELSKESE